jgi:hypothetical protein
MRSIVKNGEQSKLKWEDTESMVMSRAYIFLAISVGTVKQTVSGLKLNETQYYNIY